MAYAKITWGYTEGLEIDGFKVYKEGNLIKTINDKTAREYYDNIDTEIQAATNPDDFNIVYTIRAYNNNGQISRDIAASKTWVTLYEPINADMTSNDGPYGYCWAEESSPSAGVPAAWHQFRHINDDTSWYHYNSATPAWWTIQYYWAPSLRPLVRIGFVAGSTLPGREITFQFFGFNDTKGIDKVLIHEVTKVWDIAPGSEYTFDTNQNFKGYAIRISHENQRANDHPSFSYRMLLLGKPVL